MRIVYSETALKEFKKLDHPVQKQIKKYMDEVGNLANPRTRGKALTADFTGLWRYRVGDYRIVCDIQDELILITVLRIAHRRKIYR